MEKTNEKQITLGTLADVLKKSVLFMLIAAIVVGGIALGSVMIFSKPTYRASATFFVYGSSDNNSLLVNQTGASTTIAMTCVELVGQDMPIRKAVQYGDLIDKLGYPDEDTCVREIRKMVSAKKDDESPLMFTLIVEGKRSREDVFNIITAMNAVVPGVVEDLVKKNVSPENAPDEPTIVTPVSTVGSVNDVEVVNTSAIKAGIIAAAVAALLVYLVFFFIALFDTVVYDEQSLKDNFDLPIVGTIPNWVNSNSNKKKTKIKRDHKHGIDMSERDYTDRLLTDKTPFAVTEAFNHLRTNIVFSAGNEKGSVIAVTSAISGAGKSLITANLAISLSALGKRVLLVECDMRCPSFSRIFGNKNEKGLSEYLAGLYNDPEEIINREDGNRFDVVFSGKIPPNPSELLSTNHMDGFINQLKATYDVILLDMPPICEVADAGVVSSLVGGYLITVRCDYSDLKEVRHATELINGVRGKIYGFVLNDFNPKKVGKYARSYYNPEEKYKSAKENSF